MPPILTDPVCDEMSIASFNEISRLPCTRGVMSIFTPTSRYWNCVFTSGLMPTPPIPGWKDPVATGIRSPILSDAFRPSDARICGFCSNLLLLSEKRKSSVAWGIVTWKLLALRFLNSFKLMVPGVVLLPVFPVFPVLPVLPVLLPALDVAGFNWIVADWGG